MKTGAKIANALSAKWMLSNRANGGSVILARSLFCSVLLFILTLLVLNWIDPSKTYEFSMIALQKEIIDKIQWFGIFFATIYAAFYARFSSQWTYLANLYNSIKNCSVSNSSAKDVIAEWKAAFIEDAEYLHLACKENFASIIYHWGNEPEVKEKYIKYTPGGEARFDKVMTSVKAVYDATCKKYSTP